MAGKTDRAEQNIRTEFPDREGEPREHPLGFVPTQPDLRLSFPDFFATSVPLASVAALASIKAAGGRQLPTRHPDQEKPASPVFRPVLMRLDGSAPGELFSLERNDGVLGRAPECQIRVDDDGVSNVHASIFRSDGILCVKDLGSATGTFLNDRRVTEAQQLRDGAVVCLGSAVSFAFQRIHARHEAILRQMFEGSYRDPLTDAYNQRYVDERLHAEVAFAVRHRHPLALVVLGVDASPKKPGHRTSDATLQRVSECVRPFLRLEDVFGRYGHDEFVLVLRETEPFAAGAIAERLRSAVREAGAGHGISAGCALLEECAEPNAASLVALAKQRLAQATAKGGNRVVIG